MARIEALKRHAGSKDGLTRRVHGTLLSIVLQETIRSGNSEIQGILDTIDLTLVRFRDKYNES